MGVVNHQDNLILKYSISEKSLVSEIKLIYLNLTVCFTILSVRIVINLVHFDQKILKLIG